MDGELKLWDLQREWLGRSVEILDFFHALKRVRDVSKVVHPKETNRRRDEWVQRADARLADRQSRTVIRRWRRLSGEAEQGKRWTKDRPGRR